jgi:DnaJ-class molecular chaperone
MAKRYFAILVISTHTPAEKIRSAYRRLAKEELSSPAKPGGR